MKKRDSWFLLTGVLVLLLDQLSKFWVRDALLIHQSKPFIGEWVRFTYVMNPGGAFSSQLGGLLFYVGATSIALLLVIIYWYRNRHLGPIFSACLGLVFGGALGNLADRLYLGKVVDFIDMGVGRLRWPVYNVADIGITCGVILLFLATMFSKEPQEAGRGSENDGGMEG